MTLGAIGFVKRALPFFVALVIGVFITSFFVDLSRPRFDGFRGRGWDRFREMQRLRMDNEELRNDKERLMNDNLRLHNQIDSLTKGTGNQVSPNWDPTFDELPVPPVPPAAPHCRFHPQK